VFAVVNRHVLPGIMGLNSLVVPAYYWLFYQPVNLSAVRIQQKTKQKAILKELRF
jgi:hypothetical protein